MHLPLSNSMFFPEMCFIHTVAEVKGAELGGQCLLIFFLSLSSSLKESAREERSWGAPAQGIL